MNEQAMVPPTTAVAVVDRVDDGIFDIFLFCSDHRQKGENGQ